MILCGKNKRGKGFEGIQILGNMVSFWLSACRCLTVRNLIVSWLDGNFIGQNDEMNVWEIHIHCVT